MSAYRLSAGTIRVLGPALCLVLLVACPDDTEVVQDASVVSDADATDADGTPSADAEVEDTAVVDDLLGNPADTAEADLPESASSGPGDQDGDGVPDDKDNCPTIPNRVQRDLNSNGVGDVCDPDEPSTGVAIYGRYTLSCDALGCPDDRNIDLFRAEFDLSDGTVTHIQLTNNSDGEAGSDAAPAPDDDTPVALSQDRQWLYYQNGLSGPQDVRRVAADGTGEPTLLSPAGANNRFVHVSADDEMVYFLSDADGDDDLYQASAEDGSGLVNLSNNLEDEEHVVAVLPDGSGVVVMLGKEGNDPDDIGADGELYTVRFSDGAWVQLTDDRIWNRYQAISADGAWVAYRRPIDENNDGQQDSGSGELWVVQTDGSAEPVRLRSFVEGHLGDTYRITHDNQYVLYQFSKEGSSIDQIYAVEVGGEHEVIQLTAPTSGESSYYRMLTGDGKTLVYTSNDVTGGFGDVEVYTTPTSGGPAVLVSDLANDAVMLPRDVLDAQGTVVVEGNFDGGDYDLYVGALDGSGFDGVVVNEFFSDSYAGASPGGTWIFFRNCSHDYVESGTGCSFYGNDLDIYVARSDGQGEIHPLTANDTEDLFWQVFMVNP